MTQLRSVSVTLALLTLLGAGCTQSQPPYQTPARGYSHAKLEETPRLKWEAMSGSSMAALRLAGYYGKHPSGDDTRDKWDRIAAENGSPVGQWNFAADLERGPDDSLSNARQVYWLRRAARNEVGMAIARLEQLGIDQSALPPLE